MDRPRTDGCRDRSGETPVHQELPERSTRTAQPPLKKTKHEMYQRRRRQLTDDATWPLTHTAKIATAHAYRRAE